MSTKDTRARDVLKRLIEDGPPPTDRDHDCWFCFARSVHWAHKDYKLSHDDDCPWAAAEKLLKELEDEDEDET